MVSQLNHGMLFLPGSVSLTVEEKRGREYYTAPIKEWYSLEGFLNELPEPFSPSLYGLPKPPSNQDPGKKAKKRPKKKNVK